ncbi:MAG: sulfatase [Kiritimatiellia bacterium]
MRILYLDIDSLRPDHLGCYGYRRNTSPNIDLLAQEGQRFNRVYTSDAPCLPSRTALYTGRFGFHTGVVSHGGSAADPWPDGRTRGTRDRIECDAFPRLLQEQGFHTAQISPFGQRHAARQFYAGFNEIHNTGGGGNESAETVTPVVEKWLKDHAGSDQWYLHVNYWDPHTPYRTPAEYPNHFEQDPVPDWITPEVFERHLGKVGPHGLREINMFDDRENPKWPKHPGSVLTYDELRRVFDGYDNGVRYVDDQVGLIVKWLKEAGVYEDTAIIISADHGENLGELGIYGEHATADSATCRIPLIVKWPGITRPGTTDDGLHYHLDLPPTVAELLGAEAKPTWDGRSYAETLRNGANTGRDALIIGQCVHVCQRAVRFDRWQYIRTYDDGYHLFPTEMLFDLESDPHEQLNKAGEEPAVCDRGLRLLTEWSEEMLRSSPRNQDPLWTVVKEHGLIYNCGQLPAYCERLQATGRGWAVAELKRRHPHEFADS